MYKPCGTYVPPGHLHSGVPVNVWQQAQAETLRVWWVCESVHCQRGLRGVERLPHALVELVVGYRAPKGRLWVSHRLQVYSTRRVSEVHLELCFSYIQLINDDLWCIDCCMYIVLVGGGLASYPCCDWQETECWGKALLENLAKQNRMSTIWQCAADHNVGKTGR